MSEPVGEGDDVAAAQGGRIHSVIRAGLAQARRQLADDAHGVHRGLGGLAPAVLGQFFLGPPFRGLSQPGLADRGEVELPR